MQEVRLNKKFQAEIAKNKKKCRNQNIRKFKFSSITTYLQDYIKETNNTTGNINILHIIDNKEYFIYQYLFSYFIQLFSINNSQIYVKQSFQYLAFLYQKNLICFFKIIIMQEYKNLIQLWDVLFKRTIDYKVLNHQDDISNIQTFSENFNKELLLNQKQKDRFELLQVLSFLNLPDENLIYLLELMLQKGIESIEHLQIADDQDFKHLGINQQQKKIINKQISNFLQGDFQFNQKLQSVLMNEEQFEEIKKMLLQMNITTIQDLFQLKIDHVQGLGINKFKFKTQKDAFEGENQSNTQFKIFYQKQNNNPQQFSINIRTQNKQRELNQIIQQSKVVGQQNGFKLYQYPLYERNQLQNVESYKSMLVIGQTGCGKSTFLNYFLNYYLGVKFEDDYRFLLVNEGATNQAVSQTRQVKIYYIAPFNDKQGIRLVDTPGFGDTSGIQQDQNIESQIKKSFLSEIESLSAICFLVQASNARLTPNQNYILSSILQLFGNDIIKNFVIIFTFCDTGEPTAIQALKYTGDLKNPKSAMSDMINKIPEPWYFKFNSSAFLSNKSDKITSCFWVMAIENFQTFYNTKIIGNTPQSLILTQKVIKERDQLIVIIQNLRPKIDKLLNMIENIKDIHQQITGFDARINGSSKFKIKQKRYIINKIDIEQGQYTTNCVICNYTCHFPCKLPDNEQKIHCAAMIDGKCNQCSQKCDWDIHKNMAFRYESEQIEEVIELSQLKQQYIESKSKKSDQQQILEGIEKEYVQLQVDCMDQQAQLMNSVNELKKIALQPSCCQHHEEYVDIMIQEEMNNKRQGYLQRINQLNEIKNNWKFIREASNKQGDIEITRQFIESHIPKNLINKMKQKTRSKKI
ncbi:hypothetical protein pb186bvf_000374 [Paramecium bursaria]